MHPKSDHLLSVEGLSVIIDADKSTAHCALKGVSKSIAEGLALLYQNAPGFAQYRSENAFLVLSGEKVAELNNLIILEEQATSSQLSQFLSSFPRIELPLIVFSVSKNISPLNLQPNISFSRRFEMPVMLRDANPSKLFTPAYTIILARKISELASAREIIASAFQLPLDAIKRAFGDELLKNDRVRIFLGATSDRYTSALITTRHRKTIGIWCMGTLPEFQRQGIGRAALEFALQWHTSHGAESFFLCSSESGKKLYQTSGFKSITGAKVWSGKLAR